MPIPRVSGKPSAVRPLVSLLMSLSVAGALAIVVYLATTSLPYLVASPTTDPQFGAHNQCLLELLLEPRLGFAVSSDGRTALSFSGQTLAVCTRLPDGNLARRQVPFAGITAAAIGTDGAIWLSAEQEGVLGLWRLSPTGPVQRVGDLAPMTLTNYPEGVVVLDRGGQLVALGNDGAVRGAHQLDKGPTGRTHLASNAEGDLVALAAGTGLFVFRLPTLDLVRAEGPCQVEYLWWMQAPRQLLVTCGPADTWALVLDVISGEREVAPAKERPRSLLVPLTQGYVTACDQLPCTTPPP